ncbi:MAG: NAD(P)-binding domain-containing protein, partial [Candidatus Saccharimonadales bacterium]
MKIAVVGLGKMGAQIAKRLIDDKHEVIAVDPNPDAVRAATEFGAIAASDRADGVTKFNGEQAVVWLMIPSQFVTSEIEEWIKVLPEGSLLIDGGNTDYRETQRHAQLAAAKNVKFVDVGVSGGILGTKNGFSMMAGGDQQSYEGLKPALDALAAPRGGHEYFGEASSGHFVKMVHNAIEYGMMESLAEGYEILHQGPITNLDLAKVGRVWQQSSVIEST